MTLSTGLVMILLHRSIEETGQTVGVVEPSTLLIHLKAVVVAYVEKEEIVGELLFLLG